MERQLVIYTRFSSDMQRPESCDDQERNVRDALTRIGIDHAHALVIRDEAVAGDKAARDGFMKLRDMIERGEVALLATDDQGRLSRGNDAYGLIQDLTFNGGRFISTGEGIDTDRDGWELHVKVMSLHHSTSNRERARQVRRGQEGRVLDDGSAGDFPYGYQAEFVDRDGAEYCGRGPRPKKRIVIREPEARIVRLIFAWFIAGMSINAIARKLTGQGIDKGHRSSRPGWHHQQVRRILQNAKYIGAWEWGATITKRNSAGRKKQVPAPADRCIRRKRPDLRIIDNEVWEQAQERLAKMHEIYRRKPGQRQRGPRVHHTVIYPPGLLNGLVFCSECGSRLHVMMNATGKWLGCPTHVKGLCGIAARVPVDKAERALIGFLGDTLRAWPEWLAAALLNAQARVTELSRRIPAELAAKERELTETQRQIERLVNALAEGATKSKSVSAKIAELERREEQLRGLVEEQRAQLAAPVNVPAASWVRDQLEDLLAVLRERTPRAALLLREFVPRIDATELRPPGKKRGYMRLSFHINGWATLAATLEDRMPRSVLNALAPPDPDGAECSPTFNLDLGKPSRLDRLAPEIARLRKQGFSWNKIGRQLGLRPGNAWTAWKRFVAAQERDSAA